MTPHPSQRVYGERYRTASAEDAIEAVHGLMENARYRVEILSPDLDPRIYDQTPVMDALRRVVAEGGRRAHIRILVADPLPLVQRGHRLVNLARQVPTYVEIRVLGHDDRIDPPSFIAVDGVSYARWESGAGYEGVAGPGCRAEARQVERAFSELWNRSVTDPSLRRLHI